MSSPLTAVTAVEAQTGAEPSASTPLRRRHRFTTRSLVGQIALYAMLVVLALIYIYPLLMFSV